MKNLARRFFLYLYVLGSFAYPAMAHATSAQDIWYAPNEGGWGMNVIQQGSVLGLAIYVYDQNQNPTWYLGAGSGSVGGGWSGQMYSYRGPYFGATFNPSSVSSAQVGTFTFVLTAVQSATLTYTINGVPATKALSRLAIANDDLNGIYYGAIVFQDYNCSSASFNQVASVPATFTVSQSGASVSTLARFSDGSSCTYSGTYAQQGRYGSISGTLSCSDGTSGPFNMVEIDATPQGFSGRYTATINFSTGSCAQQGRMGGPSLSTSNF